MRAKERNLSMSYLKHIKSRVLSSTKNITSVNNNKNLNLNLNSNLNLNLNLNKNLNLNIDPNLRIPSCLHLIYNNP